MLLLLSNLVSALPRAWDRRFGAVIGRLWFYCIPVRRGVAMQNVRRVFPNASPAERRRIVRESFVHLATYAFEVLRIPSYERAEQVPTRYRGREHLDAALATGKSVIMVTAHVGNFDLAGATLSLTGYPIHVVAKDLGAFARDFVRRVRQRTGVVLLPTRKARERIREVLAAPNILVLLSDMHVAAHRGIVCDFFGELASCTPAAARFGLEADSAVVFGFCHRGEAGELVMEFEPFELETPHADPEANIRHNTERLNRGIERAVLAHPEQWHWVHKRWKVQDSPGDWVIPEKLRHLLERAH